MYILTHNQFFTVSVHTVVFPYYLTLYRQMYAHIPISLRLLNSSAVLLAILHIG